MKFAARMFVTMAVALLLASPLRADDTPKPGSPAKKDDSVSSLPAPPALAEVKAGGVTLLPVRLIPIPQPAPEAELPAMSSSSRSTSPGQMGAGSSTGGDVITPNVELFLGYSYVRAAPMNLRNRIVDLHGGDANIAFNLNRHLGLVGDFAGYHANSLQLNGSGTPPSRVVDADGRVFTYMAGPRISFRHPRFTPFIQALFGLAAASKVTISGCSGFPVCTPLPSEKVFAVAGGLGLDVTLRHNIALRLIQADYLMARFKYLSSPTRVSGIRNNMRLSAGIVFRFGGNPPPPPPPPPNRAPVTSCSADKTSVYAASGDTVAVRTQASDPDNDPLNYSWTANGGTIEGSGPEIRWNSTGASAGTYAVKVRVDDGRGGTASCSADIRVEVRPNRPPTMTCSVEPSFIQPGQRTKIRATAYDADNDPLTYSWEASGGRIAGTDATAEFDATGVAVGSYKVTGHVADGRGGTADCSVNVEVQAPQPSVEQRQLEAKLALHSIYFQTARPTAGNPGRGLVDSQAEILKTLSEDFKNYLKYRPDAHLILGGHADPRGSVEYNQGLTQRRVDRTKNFLVEHGVPEDHMDTRSFGKEDQLTADQIKELIAQDPDLSPADRQQMLNNLQVMVLANNRRVDVTLSTTGQQSTRLYPFNAKDYLALISTKGAETKPPVKQKPKR
jgi:outer membrane protein OmpA-like peptidoglycan-associated protein